MAGRWAEIGDGVFAGRYDWYEHNIGLVLDDRQAVLVDTRATEAMARQILRDLEVFGHIEIVGVVDSHVHWDHAFGNHAFRPSSIWGHRRSRPFLDRQGEAMRSAAIAKEPLIAADLAASMIDPPDRLVQDRAILEVGRRSVVLSHLGRGHTDHDLIVEVAGTDVIFVGDLFVGDRIPYFNDSYPLDWAKTAEEIARLGHRVVVPGHGDGSPELVNEMTRSYVMLASLAVDVATGHTEEAAAARAHPFPRMTEQDRTDSLRRAIRHARGSFQET
jgi:glyoxylase-like metal-dependent hydrolase (beta-lactamase superfamily II)